MEFDTTAVRRHGTVH